MTEKSSSWTQILMGAISKVKINNPLSTAYFLIFCFSLFSAVMVMGNTAQELTSQILGSNNSTKTDSPKNRDASPTTPSSSETQTPSSNSSNDLAWMSCIFTGTLYTLVILLCLHQLLVYYDLETPLATTQPEPENHEFTLYKKLEKITNDPIHNLLMLCNAFLLIFLSGKLNLVLLVLLSSTLCGKDGSKYYCDLFHAKVFSLSALLICFILVSRDVWVSIKLWTTLTEEEIKVLKPIIALDVISLLAFLALTVVSFSSHSGLRIAAGYVASISLTGYIISFYFRRLKIAKALKHSATQVPALIPFLAIGSLMWFLLKIGI